jgi:valyl-tRNA synthetase
MAALQRLAQVDACEIESLIEGDGVGAHAVLKNGTEVFIPLEGIIDVAHERKRLQVEIQRLSEQMEKARKNLANEHFMQQAPSEVVEREQGKLKSFQEQIDKLRSKFTSLAEG